MLHYVRKGSGKNIVLIHGFLGSHKVFNEMTNDLSKHFDVLAIDLPGHGNSPLEVDSYTVENYTKEVINVLEHEGIKEAVWLGHSMGGYITLYAMANESFSIPKAILLHSAVNSDDEAAIEKRTKQQQDIKQDGVDAFVDEIMPNFFSSDSSPNLTERSKEIAKEASMEGLVAALEVLKSRPNQQAFIDTTSIPVLSIEGQDDQIVKPIETTNENVKKATVRSGHMGMLEDLENVLDAIYKFLK